ncbi:MAG: S1/P1 Nuclease [Chitinophagaceae bacterium]|nr:S1/P1 Nuclease [Chitinophagaceae bacterium]
MKKWCMSLVLTGCFLNGWCWGFYGHRLINYQAVFLLPPELIAFYKPNIEFITAHAVDPDKRRYAVAEEGPRHYIDIDRYAGSVVPRSWSKAVQKFSKDTLQAHGIVPWWIQVMLQRLTRAFRERDVGAILKMSAETGHYIGDAHVPLHTSSNHNGQFTNQHGIHGFWESRIPEIFAETEWDLLSSKAVYLKNPLDFTWNRIYESAIASDSVLRVEKILSERFTPDRKYAFEERNGVIIKQYSTAYSSGYNEMLNGMIERRMRESIFAVASFWYTAWVNAGQPDLKNFVKKEISPDEKLEFETLEMKWKDGRVKGRACD